MEHCEFLVIDSTDTAGVGRHVGAFLAQQVEIWRTGRGELVVALFRSTAELEELEIFDDGECVGGFYQDAAAGERRIWRGAETALVRAVSGELALPDQGADLVGAPLGEPT